MGLQKYGQSWSVWYDLWLFMYGVKHSAGAKKFEVVESVLRFTEQLPKDQNYRLFFDNWFSTFPLLINLYSMGTLATATSRSNRIPGCPLMADFTDGKVQAKEVLAIVSIWIHRYVFWNGFIIKTWLWFQHFQV